VGECSVEALLLSVPDLSAALAGYSADELLDLFAAFDLQISYDKRDHSAEVSVALIRELLDVLPRVVVDTADRWLAAE